MNKPISYAVHLYGQYPYQELLNTFESDNLFHYTTSSTLLNILEKKKLRFSNRLYLNDKSEGKYVLDLCIKRIYDIWPHTSKYDSNKFVEALSSLSNNINLEHFQFYQVSLCKDGDNLTMWNYYSQGDGVNIKFSTSTLIESFKAHLHNPVMESTALLHGYVIYDEDEQIKIIKDMLREFVSTEEFIDEWYMFTSWAILNIGTFFKHRGFQDEREYRIAYNLFNHPETPTQCLSLYRDQAYQTPYCFEVYQRKNMLVPYVDIDFNSDAIRAITLSPNVAANYYADGLRLMLYKYKLSEVEITTSQIPLRF